MTISARSGQRMQGKPLDYNLVKPVRKGVMLQSST